MFKNLNITVFLILSFLSLIKSKKWSEFTDCQGECSDKIDCDEQCQKDFQAKCDLNINSVIKDEDACQYILEYFDNNDYNGDDNLPSEYSENYIKCTGHCINNLEDGYAVKFADCQQSCSGNIQL
ncbi:hypothetical protein PPERSA_08407 [Pseudocohnilembus persalinus]|uniref:Uncharacterized protein n=1 Tax=Pseudocohnilembus persalinus TaxID=266149 RepID=A0A0V0R672_PSEPJ|nr:hypothetical protein PPERSA_08407 [Pseudocohnilembus persalinus]|eukprot:KRX10004.1 hypothetical protein PPERSA_08407 [Pseudocohnilembus persalinus]